MKNIKNTERGKPFTLLKGPSIHRSRPQFNYDSSDNGSGCHTGGWRNPSTEDQGPRGSYQREALRGDGV